MGLPIRGQDVLVRMTQNGEIQDFPVKSVEISSKNEIQTDGYLGENFDRRTAIHSGFSGRMTGHMETSKAMDFLDAIDRAAQGEGITFSMIGQFLFPDGTRKRYQWTGLVFGETSTNIDDRKTKVPINLPFECEKKKPLAGF